MLDSFRQESRRIFEKKNVSQVHCSCGLNPSGFLTLLSQSPRSLGGELGCTGLQDPAAGYLPDSFLPHSLNPCLFRFLCLTDQATFISLPRSLSILCVWSSTLCPTNFIFLLKILWPLCPKLFHLFLLQDSCFLGHFTIVYISSVYKCETETTPDISSAKFHYDVSLAGEKWLPNKWKR